MFYFCLEWTAALPCNLHWQQLSEQHRKYRRMLPAQLRQILLAPQFAECTLNGFSDVARDLVGRALAATTRLCNTFRTSGHLYWNLLRI